MQRTTHGQYLTQLTRLPRLFPANGYFVREDDGLTLIDTMIPGSEKKIIAAAEEIGLPIVRVALTHGHGDHVGSLDALQALLPNAEMLFTERTSRLLAGDRGLEPDEPQTPVRGWWIDRTTRPTRTIAPGDRVGSLQVIASPGHSPDHVSFFDTRDGVLIAGDAFQTRGGVAVSGTLKPLFPFPAMATWHKPTALSSAQSLRALQPSRLAVGHGKVLENPLEAMDRAIAEAQRKIEPQPSHVR